MTGFYKPTTNGVPSMYKREERETVESIRDYPWLSNPERGVRDEIYKYLGFKMALDPSDGTTPIAAYYPILRDGKLVAWKKRDYRKKKSECFSIIGQADLKCDLIGAHRLKEGRKIFVTEGEECLAATFQALKDNIDSNPKWKGKIHPNVVSIMAGAPYAAEHLTNNIETLGRYNEIVTVFDNDKCTVAEYNKGFRRGYEATCETHLALGFDKCKYVPLKYKDPSEYLQKGQQEELVKTILFGAKDFVPITITEWEDCSIDELTTPLKGGIKIPALPKLSAMMRGLRPHEMTLLMAPSGVGKSTLAKEIAYSILTEGDENEKIGMIFLEETQAKTRQSLIAIDNNVLIPAFREDPSIIPREDVQKSIEKFKDKTVFLKTQSGKLTPEQLIQNINILHAKGCTKILLDHLSYVISGSESDNERRSIDLLMTEMAAICENNPLHLIVISHVKRNDFKPPKDEGGETIYPYWQPVKKTDGRGSGGLEQLAWNIICVEPEILDEYERRGRVRLNLVKSREWGETGLCDTVTMDRQTGRLVKA